MTLLLLLLVMVCLFYAAASVNIECKFSHIFYKQ